MGSFSIWHFLILLIGVAIVAGGVAFVVWLCVRASRKSQPVPAQVGTAQDRLRQLDELNAGGALTEAEYQRQRAAIVGSI